MTFEGGGGLFIFFLILLGMILAFLWTPEGRRQHPKAQKESTPERTRRPQARPPQARPPQARLPQRRPPQTDHPQARGFQNRNAEPPAPNSILIGRAFIVDGDSLRIQHTEIRLFGIDAPEINHPFGRQAKWTLLSLCRGQVIRA